MIARWWQCRNGFVMPEIAFLPALGYIAEDLESKALSASFLYIANGTKGGVALIEYTITNPDGKFLAVGRSVKVLWKHMMEIAWDRGCRSVFSLVAQNKGEQHMFEGMGFENVGGVPHMVFGRPLLCR